MVHKPEEVESVLQRCINESPSKQVFVEKAIVGAKHIEIQILGDKHGSVVHLRDRDCSVQRRFQKIIEVCMLFLRIRGYIE
jgi:pyruvate carboxylase